MSTGELEGIMKRMGEREISTLSDINKWSNRLHESLYIDRSEAGESEL